MRRLPLALSLACLLSTTALAQTAAPPMKLNEAGYYAAPGAEVLVFSNWYDSLFSDAKISGVELVQRGVRTATNGDVRLSPTPGQWDPIGKLVDRKVDPKTGVVEATLEYAEHGFRYVIRSEPRGASVVVSIVIDKPLPKALEGKAGFNLEFLPSAYFRKTFMADGKAGVFPLYPASDMGPGDGRAEPLPLAQGKRLVLSPEDAGHRVTLTSATPIALYDGRNQAQNGWFVARGLLPSGQTGKVLEWTLTPQADAAWVRPPMIAHSQVGYAPSQTKTAVIELDAADKAKATARLLRISDAGAFTTALEAPVKPWGRYLRYNYGRFDFTSVKQPGAYVVEYGGTRSAPFRIGPDVYADAWHPTLDVYFPVAMDHMFVNEAYRVWHGEAHKDDALQAPVNHEHLDLYAQGPTTDTAFKPGEHIPGLNIGGWFDAGDFDIRTQTQYAVVRNMVETWETFRPTRDQTSVDDAARRVEMHIPDGKPDLVQQIRHGVLQLVAQHKAVGHATNGIVEPDVEQYTHLGDAVTKTDGIPGNKDDRWAFTSKSTALNYGSIAALAAASRALRGADDALADESLAIAKRVWDEEHTHAPNDFRHGNTTGGHLVDEEFDATVELLATTKDPKYAARIDAMWPEVERRFAFNARTAVQAIPFMPAAYKTRMEPAVRAWLAEDAKLATANPFGVFIGTAGWAGSGQVVEAGLTHAALRKAFPAIVPADGVYRALDYLFGTHPGSNLSLVSGVGTQSKEVAYGNNRADFSFIAGGVVPGVLIIKPDLPENKEDWPFLWGENEYVVNVASGYMLLALTADAIAQGQ
ncbi:glycoside hydrolase family 9 protein [Caulobacter sp.]|uniref:glycoside hydrolase family 9 protein n=1 Tax=Caulobacter sp. TaxID=78 RepID=UPI001B1AD992|nr:glycoside hydrolase family 9 protein [Caulobacter sp.]MBO9547076.1 glycoside hydrolase family 9 protein [Caulobacter sp.]